MICKLENGSVAAKGTRIKFVSTAAAEKCPFANKLAEKYKILEILFEDIQKMDETQAKSFVTEALRIKAMAISVIGGFPCKGLSRTRGAFRENIKTRIPFCFGNPNESST